MAQRKRRHRVRYDRILVTAGVLVVLIILLVSCVRSCGKEDDTPQTPTTPIATTAPNGSQSGENGDTTSTDTNSNTDQPDTTGYSKISVSKDKIYQGDLILVNRENVYRFPSDTSNLVSVYLNKLSTYGVKDAELSLDKHVIE